MNELTFEIGIFLSSSAQSQVEFKWKCWPYAWHSLWPHDDQWLKIVNLCSFILFEFSLLKLSFGTETNNFVFLMVQESLHNSMWHFKDCVGGAFHVALATCEGLCKCNCLHYLHSEPTCRIHEWKMRICKGNYSVYKISTSDCVNCWCDYNMHVYYWLVESVYWLSQGGS